MLPPPPRSWRKIICRTLHRGAYLIDGAEEICRYLAPNYRLAILTNGIQEVQTSRFQASPPLVPYFDRLIISEEVGFSKPPAPPRS